MPERKSNENQSVTADRYCFGDYELSLRDRLLERNGVPVPLAPKTFDALVCFVSRAGGLITKAELFATLWPSTFVSDASLTNVIVALRKELGPEAIRTVSKHGYRFGISVSCEPGYSAELYARFVRARELTAQRSLPGVQQACELYCTCLAENPQFAPAWAWLGRSVYLITKITGSSQVRVDLAAASFRRALAIDPDLACAHQFATSFEADTGQARAALTRLLKRVAKQPTEPESFAGLTQVFRYCGLLDESITAGSRAKELDPALATSVSHTHFLKCDYPAAIDSYAGRAGAYLDAAAWAALGESRRTIQLLRERLEGRTFSGTLDTLMRSLLAIVEGRADDACQAMNTSENEWDPESAVYFARQYAHVGAIGRSVAALRQAAAAGFICAPATLSGDPWFQPLRTDEGYPLLLAEMEREVLLSRALLGEKWC